MSNSDSELEEDEEEILVYVEFDNCATNDVFNSQNLKLDMLGLDSDHPVMQVNGKFFEGTYEDAVGTYLFFEKDDNPQVDDPVFDKIPTLKYFDKTRKILRMQRAFVVPRYEVVGDSEHSQSIPNIETLKEAGVPPKYQEEALSFWIDSRNKRVNALHEYLKKQEFRKELRMRGFEPESESDEDNPFAMYKYEENLENETEASQLNENNNGQNIDFDTQIKNLETTLQMTELNNGKDSCEKDACKIPKKLTVIDPGPSTSKSSIPWIGDDLPEQQSMAHKLKSVGKVKEKTFKGKVQKKTLRKKKISVSQKNLNENSVDQPLVKSLNENQLNKTEVTNENKESDNKPNKSKRVPNSENIKLEQMEVDEEIIEESGRLLSEELNLGDSFITDKNKRKKEKREAKMREISEKLKALSESSSQPKS